MCPICMAAAAVIVVKGTGGGGAAAFVAGKFLKRRNPRSIQSKTGKEEVENGNRDDRSETRERSLPR